MKAIAVLLFVYVFGNFGESHSLLDETGNCVSKECQFFANLKVDDLKPLFQAPLKALSHQIKRNADRDINRWCCRNGDPVGYQLVTTTYVHWEPYGQTITVSTGNVDCGFLGLSSCATYTTGFVPTSHVMIGYELQLNPDAANSCEDHHVVCCKGTMLIAGSCLTPSEFSELTTTWVALLPYLQQTMPNYTMADLIIALQNHGITQPKP